MFSLEIFLKCEQKLCLNFRSTLCCICSYDYSGYGASTGKVCNSSDFLFSPLFFCSLVQNEIFFELCLWLSLQLWQPSEFNTYCDIEAVYNCLKNEYGIKQEELILYGQSVGSGPTLHLASKLQKLRGVVLHSAILSGIRVLYPVKMTFWFDIFKVSFAWRVLHDFYTAVLFGAELCSNKNSLLPFQNIDKIRLANCTVFVIRVSIYFHFCFNQLLHFCFFLSLKTDQRFLCWASVLEWLSFLFS